MHLFFELWVNSMIGKLGSFAFVIRLRRKTQNSDPLYFTYWHCVATCLRWKGLVLTQTYIHYSLIFQNTPYLQLILEMRSKNTILFVWILRYINLCRLFNATSIFIQISKSNVGDRSRGLPEGPLFNSYFTEM